MCTNFWINPHNGKLPSRLAPAQCQNSLAPQLLSNNYWLKTSINLNRVYWYDSMCHIFSCLLEFSRCLFQITILLLVCLTVSHVTGQAQEGEGIYLLQMMNEWVIDWLIDWLTDWLIAWLSFNAPVSFILTAMSRRYLWSFMTFTRLEAHVRLNAHFWDIGKQWRPWSDAASCGVWSRSGLHCLLIGISFINKIKIKTYTRPLNWKCTRPITKDLANVG